MDKLKYLKDAKKIFAWESVKSTDLIPFSQLLRIYLHASVGPCYYLVTFDDDKKTTRLLTAEKLDHTLEIKTNPLFAAKRIFHCNGSDWQTIQKVIVSMAFHMIEKGGDVYSPWSSDNFVRWWGDPDFWKIIVSDHVDNLGHFSILSDVVEDFKKRLCYFAEKNIKCHLKPGQFFFTKKTLKHIIPKEVPFLKRKSNTSDCHRKKVQHRHPSKEKIQKEFKEFIGTEDDTF